MKKRNVFRFVLTLALLMGVLIAFFVFLDDNEERIARQNEEYLTEFTSQRAISIDSLISENLTFIRSTAYLYGRQLSSPWANVAVIREYEENTVFDRLCFVDASGDDYTSRGVKANLSDRDYFRDGMNGGSGVVYVPVSRVTGQKQIGFYAPVTFDGEIIGIMVGFYQEAYIRALLEYELFGQEGEGWLCLSDGTIVGASVDCASDNFFDFLSTDGQCDEDSLSELRQLFSQGGSGAFSYAVGSSTATGYLVGLENIDWVLVRSFPASASQTILENANREGVRLVTALIAMFALYALTLAVGVAVEMRRTREANRNANDIATGTSRLFEKFLALDLNEDRYRYIDAEPDDPMLPGSGEYAQFSRAFLNRITDPAQRDAAEAFIDKSQLMRALQDSDVTSIRIHAPLRADEWFTYSFIVLARENRRPTRLLVVRQDVTELNRREEANRQRLEQALSDAQRASRAKTTFLFNMSHDLRTPMNAIIGYTKLALGEDADAGQVRAYVEKIDASSHHLLSLINDILEMSRIESGKIVLEAAPTDLDEVMTQLRELFQTQMSEKGIDFGVSAEALHTPRVLCDRARLDRVLLNLVSNAWKFTPKGGRVRVTLEEGAMQNGRVPLSLTVADTGIGMSETFVEKLFTPFERERTSTVSGIQGTGLGLSITKNLVERMGGTIEVSTRKGEGTTFTVHLAFPAAQAEADPPAPEAANDAAVHFEGRKLLLVEDNDINREIASMILSQAGFALDTAKDGREAFERVQSADPFDYDTVLMDIQMPVMNGYEATRAIRSLNDPARANVPIVAMTANAFKEDVQAARDAGMNAHIAKPLDVQAMFKTLALVLSGKKDGPDEDNRV